MYFRKLTASLSFAMLRQWAHIAYANVLFFASGCTFSGLLC